MYQDGSYFTFSVRYENSEMLKALLKRFEKTKIATPLREKRRFLSTITSLKGNTDINYY